MRALVKGVLELLAPAPCLGCDELDRRDFCSACALLLEAAPGANATFLYGGPIAQAIHRLKYEGRSELGVRLGRLMAAALTPRAGVDAVVPVPLHWRRRRQRGFDQAALLARPVAAALGTSLLLGGLHRARNTRRQVELAHAERQRNVAGAFAPGKLRRVRRVLLIDDVRTSGATLRAASAALRAGGVEEVWTYTLATRVLGEGT